MTRVIHLIVGPDDHGVVRHGCQVAAACGHDVVRVAAASEVTPAAVRGADVVHVPFTDRLFAPTCEQSVSVMQRLADAVVAGGAELSLTLHDLPRGTDSLAERRRIAYRAVSAMARGVVVNSRIELGLIEDSAAHLHSLRCIPLPVEVAPAGSDAPSPSRPPGDATVLGFVFPDRGYEAVLAALPPGGHLVALGRAAVGHEDLPGRLGDLAITAGRHLDVTGFITDAELPGYLRHAVVPIAPNQRVTASASIGTWLAHGRRPLVPDVPYTRELAARMPAALTLYDPRTPDGLARALARASADPASTWLPADVVLGPSMTHVAAEYAGHLDACVSPRRLADRTGGHRVPGNRWDLLVPNRSARPHITVVVPYYHAPAALTRLLAALAAQTVADRVEVVVADDGSPQPPDVSASRLPVRVVRQERRGFGAARARNLGASAATAEVLAFLDVDMVPEPSYLERLVRLPALYPDCVTVGRRRHADLDGWTPSDVGEWLAGRREPPLELPEPQWLAAAYRASADLAYADRRSYRFVISAVLALPTSLFHRLGGFHSGFDSYGGEDWEFAHRAWTAGALLAHVRDAIAWHDGPDWAGRDLADRRAAKNVEMLQVSRLIPDPALRGAGQWMPYVHSVVTMPGGDVSGVLATARSAFAAGADCGVWLTGPDAEDAAAVLADGRIHAGAPPPDVLARAGVLVEVSEPCDLSGLARLAEIAADLGVVVTPAAYVRSLRGINRFGADAGLAAAMLGRHDRTTPMPYGDVELERLLPATVG